VTACESVAIHEHREVEWRRVEFDGGTVKAIEQPR
jgi:hypothetical protein